MCWNGKLTDKHIANKEIIVYKILMKDKFGNYRAPYYMTTYHLGKLYTTNIHPELEFPESFNNKDIKINEGFHSFNKKCLMHSIDNTIIIYDEKNCFINSISKYSRPLVIAKCTIPKYSIYYETSQGEIVSDAIIVDKIHETYFGENKIFNDITDYVVEYKR